MLKKIRKYEGVSDTREIEIAEYITKLLNEEVTPKTSIRMRSILNISSELERIADIYYQLSKSIEKKIEDKIYFMPEQRNNINEMIDKIDEALQVMVTNLSIPSYDDVSKTKSRELEDEINALRNQYRKELSRSIGSKDYNINSAMVYSNVFSSLERIGDHVVNVTEAIAGEI